MISATAIQHLPASFAKSGKAQAVVSKPTSIAEDSSKEILFSRMSKDSGLAQTQYLGTTLNVQRIQNALRSAERGDTWMFFTIVRDMIASYTHLNTEWNKRKMVIVGQPMSLIPANPTSADDKLACEVIREAIDNCRNWQDGLQHLLDATLMPLSAVEKIWEPTPLSNGKFKYLKRFSLKEIAPVSYTTFCFKIPYLPSFGGTANPAANFNADDWEAWLRFYATEPNGYINYGTMNVYQPLPSHHIVHRGNLQSPTIPPNFGGLIRPILFWWLLATQDRDWWSLMMQKYQMPIPVGKVDAQNQQTVNAMQSALALGMQIGGIVIDKRAELEFMNAAGADGSNGHKIYQDFCNCEVSKLVVGQVTSSRPEKGGLAAGMAEQAESVRDDIRVWDVGKLADTLQRQLFRQILDLNGYSNCGVPRAFWGGMAPSETTMLGKTLTNFYQAGVRLTPAGIVSVSERTGLSFEAIPEDVLNPQPSMSNGNGKGKKGKDGGSAS